MTTKLSQRRVKSYDPAYPNLMEQLQAKNIEGGTGGYVMPVGGIPRTDMTTDVQTALTKAENSYPYPVGGIPVIDLATAIQDSLTKADAAYQKPASGIPATDLEISIQERLNDFSDFYVYPSTGIPYVDLDTDVKGKLDLADSAYQKPSIGIPRYDLAQGVQDTLVKADHAYQKPAGGIPLTDLAFDPVVESELQPIRDHMNNTSLHVTDHTQLANIGLYSHGEIDHKLDDQYDQLMELYHEVRNARDTFGSLGERIDASLGLNTEYIVNDATEWSQGTLDYLQVTEEGKVAFSFQPEPIIWDLFDITQDVSLLPEKRIGGLYMSDSMYLNLQSKPWVEKVGSPSVYDWVGLRWVGWVFAPKTGTYSFGTQFSGRIRMMVAGRTLLDGGGVYDYESGYSQFSTIDLVGGIAYPIVIEGWYYTEGQRVIGVYWQPPEQSTFTTIPMDCVNMNGYARNEGIYESHVIDLQDSAISMWYLHAKMTDYRQEDDLTAEVATSEDGLVFTDWSATPLNAEIALTPKRFVKVRLTLHKYSHIYTPRLDEFMIRYISSGNNKYLYEIIEARDTFLQLKDRFDYIEGSLLDLSTSMSAFQASGLHPDYFVSTRLSAYDFNNLRSLYEYGRSLSDYMPIQDGWVDHFKTAQMIDMELSDPHTLSGGQIKHKQLSESIDTNSEWGIFSLNGLDYVDHQMRLANQFLNASFINQPSINNEAQRLNDGTALVGSHWRKFLAQPFYTGPNTNKLSYIRLNTVYSYNAGYGSYAAGVRIMVCGTSITGYPDYANPIWYGDMNVNTQDVAFNTNIPVAPYTKYWIVVQLNWSSANGYGSVGYATFATTTTSTDTRLLSNNPEQKALPFLYTDSYSPQDPSWNVDTGTYLRFVITEQAAYTPEGWAEGVLDFLKPQIFLSSSFLATLKTGAILDIQYAGSNDNIMWSPFTTEIETLPPSRFLKVSVHMTRGTTNDTSWIQSITVNYRGEDLMIISKTFDMSYIPHRALFLSEQSDRSHVQYFISRDDGRSWIPFIDNTYTDLMSIRPGTKLRIKAILDGNVDNAFIEGWAVQGLIYREISGQNIAALHEEYQANHGQTIFTTQTPYPMGKHALEVYVNGIYQSIGKDYNEVDNHTIEFTEPLIGLDAIGEEPDIVTLRVATGAYDLHDMELVKRIDDLEHQMDSLIVGDYQAIEYEYDEQGLLIKETYTGGLYHTIEYAYDDQKRKIKRTETEGTKVTVYDYIYDPDTGRLQRTQRTISEVTI